VKTLIRMALLLAFAASATLAHADAIQENAEIRNAANQELEEVSTFDCSETESPSQCNTDKLKVKNRLKKAVRLCDEAESAFEAGKIDESDPMWEEAGDAAQLAHSDSSDFKSNYGFSGGDRD
jgi:hypothetical protein